MDRSKAVGGASGADYTQYTGIRRNIALDKQNEARWEIVNNGTNTLQERLIQRAMNGGWQIATNRA